MTTFGWRTRNPGYLMYTATGLCIRDKLQVIHRRGFDTMTDAQLALFHHIDVEGTRLTTIAARSELTKQSMIELVDRSEKNGFVRRSPDPNDKRAKIVTLTQSGFRLLEALHEGIAFSERRMEEIVGTNFLEEMKSELGLYFAGHLTNCDPDNDRTDFSAQAQNIARILSFAARRFATDALKIARQNGYGTISEGSLALFRNLALEGSRLTDIARQARMTKQSMRELVDRAATLGFVSRERATVDGRVKVITFTPAGLAMLEQIRRGVADAEKDLRRRTTNGFVGRLRTGLTGYIRAAP